MISKIDTLSALLVSLIVLVMGTLTVKNLSVEKEVDTTALLNGKIATFLENTYDENFPLKNDFSAFWAAIKYQLFKEGKTGVIVGKDDWLFTNEEYRWNAQSQVNLTDNLSKITALYQFFQQKDVDLTVVLIPEKVEVYQDKTRFTSNHVAHLLRAQITQYFTNQEIPVIDLYTPLMPSTEEEQVFMRTDTHWSPKGAHLSSDYIAQVIGEWGTKKFETQLVEQEDFRGDLLNYIPLTSYLYTFGPKSESISLYETHALDSASDSMNLFSEDMTDIALVGTSYSANSKWHFVAFLQQALKTDILDFSEEGKGPFAPMYEAIEQGIVADDIVKQILWEIPIRYLVSEQPELPQTLSN